MDGWANRLLITFFPALNPRPDYLNTSSPCLQNVRNSNKTLLNVNSYPTPPIPYCFLYPSKLPPNLRHRPTIHNTNKTVSMTTYRTHLQHKQPTRRMTSFQAPLVFLGIAIILRLSQSPKSTYNTEEITKDVTFLKHSLFSITHRQLRYATRPGKFTGLYI